MSENSDLSHIGSLPEGKDGMLATLLYLARKYGLLNAESLLAKTGGVAGFIYNFKLAAPEVRGRILLAATNMEQEFGEDLSGELFDQLLSRFNQSNKLKIDKLFLKLTPAEYQVMVATSLAKEIIRDQLIMNHGWFTQPQADKFISWAIRVILNRDPTPDIALTLIEAIGWEMFTADPMYPIAMADAVEPRSTDKTAPNNVRRVNFGKILLAFAGNASWLKINFSKVYREVLWQLSKLLEIKAPEDEVVLEIDEPVDEQENLETRAPTDATPEARAESEKPLPPLLPPKSIAKDALEADLDALKRADEERKP